MWFIQVILVIFSFILLPAVSILAIKNPVSTAKTLRIEKYINTRVKILLLCFVLFIVSNILFVISISDKEKQVTQTPIINKNEKQVTQTPIINKNENKVIKPIVDNKPIEKPTPSRTADEIRISLAFAIDELNRLIPKYEKIKKSYDRLADTGQLDEAKDSAYQSSKIIKTLGESNEDCQKNEKCKLAYEKLSAAFSYRSYAYRLLKDEVGKPVYDLREVKKYIAESEIDWSEGKQLTKELIKETGITKAAKVVEKAIKNYKLNPNDIPSGLSDK